MQYNINLLPEKIKNEETNIKEACKIIWAELYMSPELFGLSQLDEDAKSDFLMEFQSKLPDIIKIYDSSKTEFTVFLRSCITLQLKTWITRRYKEKIEKSSMEAYIFSRLEDELLQNQDFNNNAFINLSLQNTDITENRMKISRLCMLILTLKACKDLDDDLIEKICSYTKIDKEFIYEKIESMKNNMHSKDLQREKLIEKRNNAFYFHRRYEQELKRLSKDDFSFNNLHERYVHQTESWIKSNRLLSKKYRNSPSNLTVAKALGLRPRTVGFYIQNIKRFSPEKNDAVEGLAEMPEKQAEQE